MYIIILTEHLIPLFWLMCNFACIFTKKVYNNCLTIHTVYQLIKFGQLSNSKMVSRESDLTLNQKTTTKLSPHFILSLFKLSTFFQVNVQSVSVGKRHGRIIWSIFGHFRQLRSAQNRKKLSKRGFNISPNRHECNNEMANKEKKFRPNI